jgi:hypothetical protein
MTDVDVPLDLVLHTLGGLALSGSWRLAKRKTSHLATS